MAATEHPNVALTEEGQAKSKDWTLGDGENQSREWTGSPEKCNTKFNDLVAEGNAGANIRALAYRRRNGRATLTASYGRNDGNVQAIYPEDVTMIEEVYAVDIMRDVRAAPYWTTTVNDPVTVLTDDQVIDVTGAVENNLKDAEITNWGTWTDSQKELRYHMVHGQDTYYETGFIMRQSLYGARTSEIKGAFTYANTVVTAPVYKTAMLALLEALPAGEWLLKPPQAEYLGKGKWRVSIEYHWAQKWSIIYGGTWARP